MCGSSRTGPSCASPPEDSFLPAFPENIDLKIAGWCDVGCTFCHENAGPDGTHADLQADFLNTLHPGTERFPLLPDIREMFAGIAVCCEGRVTVI